MKVVGPYSGSPFFIYALCEPDTLAVRYVGMSSRGLVRPAAHLHPSNTATVTAKNVWIRSLLRRGLEPVVQVLGEFDNEAVLGDAERGAIARLRQQGAQLTNVLDGGVPAWAVSLPWLKRTGRGGDRLTPHEKAESAGRSRTRYRERVSPETWITSEIKKRTTVGQYLAQRRAAVAAALGMTVQQAVAAVTFEPVRRVEAA